MVISETLQGKFIFETESGYNGHSGMAEYEFAYIRVKQGASANGSFSYTCIPGLEMTLDKVTGNSTYSVVWKTSVAPECHPFAICGLKILNPTIITTISDFYNSPVFEAEVSISGDASAGNYYFDLVPIKYEVVFNNVKYTAETEFDGVSYVAHIPELCLSFMAMSYEDLSEAAEVSDEDFRDGTVDLITLLVVGGLVGTRSDGRRAIEQGGVTVNGEKETDVRKTYTKDDFGDGIVIKKGKKSFKKLVLK